MRPYQVEANTAIEQAIRDRKRKLLVTMATGTGKTLTMVNETYRLMKSGVARRVLFLVDRRALAAQAVRAFASFEAEPGLKFDKIYPAYSQRFQQSDVEEGGAWDPNVMPNALLTSPKLGDAFVYVCTIQRMAMNLLGGEGTLTLGEEPVDADVEQLNVPAATAPTGEAPEPPVTRPDGSGTDDTQEDEATKLNLTGRLGRSPAFRTTKSGALVGKFPLAVHREDGQTTWHTVLAFGPRAEQLRRRAETGELAKGREVDVIGYLHVNERPGKDGPRKVQEVYAVAVKKR